MKRKKNSRYDLVDENDMFAQIRRTQMLSISESIKCSECILILFFLSSPFFSIPFFQSARTLTPITIINYFTHLMMRGNDEITLAFLFLNDITKIVRATQYDDAMNATSWLCAKRQEDEK